MTVINKTNPSRSELNFREFCKDVKKANQETNYHLFKGLDYKRFIHNFKAIANEVGLGQANFFNLRYIPSDIKISYEYSVLLNPNKIIPGFKVPRIEKLNGVCIVLDNPIVPGRTRKSRTKVRLVIATPDYGEDVIAIQVKYHAAIDWSTIYVKHSKVGEVLSSIYG